MPNTIDLRTLITQEATAQGVPPAIALSVAQTESGIAQWTPSGNLVTSSAGALGVFQLMPSTAAGLGVDPTDLNENIQGGITYLKQLYGKYGNWSTALAAYNWGPGNVDSGNPIPTSVLQYASGIMSAAGNFAAGLFGGGPPAPGAIGLTDSGDVTAGDIEASVMGSSGIIAIGAIAAALGIVWVLRD
jgi:soluble lytic murein transglycosylase-like protein